MENKYNNINDIVYHAIISGCLKPTKVEDLYCFAEIAATDIRGNVCAIVV